MRLIIVRHGESEANVTGVSQGHLNSPLTQKGTQQAQKLAFRLKDEQIDLAFTSDLDRARSTCKEIMKFHSSAEIIVTRKLREQFKSIYEGKPNELNHKRIADLKVPYYLFDFDDGESYIDVQKRIVDFYEEIFKKYPDKTVLLCTHDGPIVNLLLYLFDKTQEEYREYLPKGNTALSIIEIDEEKKAYGAAFELY